jgi:SAM-dependent methyltransferase
MKFNAPLSEERAAQLSAFVIEVQPGVVLDLGCGRGEFLLQVLAGNDDVRGIGVDLNDEALTAARAKAERHGLSQRVTFVEADARAYEAEADVVINIGASHAFDGLAPMLAAFKSRRAIVGDAFWAAPPDPWCTETFGDLPEGLEAVREIASAAGWQVAGTDTSTIEEWDEFETNWRRGVEPRFAALRKAEYEQRYRGVLGFAWLVLDR